MTDVSKRLVFEVVALVVVLIAVSTEFASPPGDSRSPWKEIAYDAEGRVMAARGYDAPEVPLALTVTSQKVGDRLIATTTFVRGKETLKMERIYDGTGDLDVTYSTGTEKVRLLVRRDPASEETEALVMLPDGEVRSIVVDASRGIVSGDPRGWHEAILAKTHMVPLVREFDRHAASLGGPVPMAGTILMWKVPDGGCLDSCSEGCKHQCAWECTATILIIPCASCQTACMAGCFIGCAS
jgi:hypothetical protein